MSTNANLVNQVDLWALGRQSSEPPAKPAPATRVVKYLGDPRCDICEREIKCEGEVMFDAAMRVGTWAKMCKACFSVHGAGLLGTGHGQKYEVQNGELVKVAG